MYIKYLSYTYVLCLYNYFLTIYVQPEDGYYQEPKHVVVP